MAGLGGNVTDTIVGVKTLVLTVISMFAFAANSVLCRLALAGERIDPAAFTLLRLASGVVMLLAIVALRGPSGAGVAPETTTADRGPRAWIGGLYLFAYAAAFSFAYVELDAGTGALILFGTVQLTMILAGLRGGERPPPREWVGFAAAAVGLVALIAPGATAPAPGGAVLMTFAGLAWGLYSLRGRGAGDPVLRTRTNFLRALPPSLVLAAALFARLQVSMEGLLLAVASGALASGLGYVVWYAALPGLTATRAATVQLSVPVLAAIGGILLLDESLTPRFAVSSVLILGGIGLAVTTRSAPTRGRQPDNRG